MTPQAVRVPYTHGAHSARCVEAGRRGVMLEKAHVQVRTGRAVLCARVLRAWTGDEGAEMWRLQAAYPSGRLVELVAPAGRVRQCSGVDGHCVCAGEKSASSASPEGRADAFFDAGLGCGFSQAGVVAPPESLTGETDPVSEPDRKLRAVMARLYRLPGGPEVFHRLTADRARPTLAEAQAALDALRATQA